MIDINKELLSIIADNDIEIIIRPIQEPIPYFDNEVFVKDKINYLNIRGIIPLKDGNKYLCQRILDRSFRDFKDADQERFMNFIIKQIIVELLEQKEKEE